MTNYAETLKRAAAVEEVHAEQCRIRAIGTPEETASSLLAFAANHDQNAAACLAGAESWDVLGLIAAQPLRSEAPSGRDVCDRTYAASYDSIIKIARNTIAKRPLPPGPEGC